MMDAVKHFDKMFQCMDHTECIKLHQEFTESGQKKVLKCWWPRYHACLESLKSDKFMGVDIKKTADRKQNYITEFFLQIELSIF